MSGPATDPVIAALERAVAGAPDDLDLRVHLAGLLLAAGRRDESVSQSAAALQIDPASPAARAAMNRALGGGAADGGPGTRQAPGEPAAVFDWRVAESEVGHIAEPMFVESDPAADSATQPVSGWEVERSAITLADVGGMPQVKDRLEAAFLAPLRNPELRRLYGKSLRGGLLLYGPPGCGKTFVARAVAGEMGAKFITVGLADILDMYVGNSERNVADLFTLARREAPVVLFLDEVDALGQKRSSMRGSAGRGAVVQLLTELDGVDEANEGVFVLAATNQPWDVDPALRRPGRLDRMLLVSPPDAEARESVLRFHLRHRPVEGIDLRRLAKASDGYSGADLAHVCETASERALLDGVRSGNARLIGMADLEAALKEVRPSTGAWFDLARNVVMFADEDGAYAELRAWMKKAKRL